MILFRILWFLMISFLLVRAGASRSKQSGQEAAMSGPKLPEAVAGGTRPRSEERAAATENSGSSPVLRPGQRFQAK